jgi:hypothetical protein
MQEQMSAADKSRLARNLRRLLPAGLPSEDETLNNSAAANFMGGISVKTLGRIAFPHDLDGPVPIRFSENGNLYWSKRDLQAYKIRRQIRLETTLMDSVERRSLLADLMEN